MLSRRHFTTMIAAGTVTSLIGLDRPFVGRALAAGPTSTDLAQPGPLGDVWLGPPTAKCTIIEYASMTCTHCAAFHAETWPKLKSTYVDTGKARFTLREFPLDPLATAGFMLARSAGDDRYYAMIDLLFDKQNDWAFVPKPLNALESLTKQAGFTQKTFNDSLKNQKIRAGVEAVRSRAENVFGVDATPTFFINGKKYDGEMTFEAMDKIISPIVNS